MNLTFGKTESESVTRSNSWTNRIVGDLTVSIESGYRPYVIVMDRVLSGSVVSMNGEEAIALAEAILTEFRIPFCNRASDGTPTP